MNATNELVAYLNGEYLPISQCKISVMDIGITNGASVTDFTRTFNHNLFRLEEDVYKRQLPTMELKAAPNAPTRAATPPPPGTGSLEASFSANVQISSSEISILYHPLKQARNDAIVIHIDFLCCRYPWQPRHGHDIPRQSDDKSCTRRDL